MNLKYSILKFFVIPSTIVLFLIGSNGVANASVERKIGSSWMEYRDLKHGFGFAIPSDWNVYPASGNGKFTVTTIMNYSGDFARSNSEGNFWGTGAMKIDFYVIQEIDPNESLTDATLPIIAGELNKVIRVEEQIINEHPAILLFSQRKDITFGTEISETVAFRLSPDKILLVAVIPTNTKSNADVQAILNSIAITPDETVKIPSTTPSPALTSNQSLRVANGGAALEIHPCDWGNEVGDSPIELFMPFSEGTTWTVGGEGSYYGDYAHIGNDYYATDWNRYLSGYMEDLGEAVYPVAPGTVIYIGTDTDVNGGYGHYVKIEHEQNVVTRYAHLLEEPNYISVGDLVGINTTIGQLGSSGNSVESHLHLSFYVDGISQQGIAPSRRPSPMWTTTGWWDLCDSESRTVTKNTSTPTPTITASPTATATFTPIPATPTLITGVLTCNTVVVGVTCANHGSYLDYNININVTGLTGGATAYNIPIGTYKRSTSGGYMGMMSDFVHSETSYYSPNSVFSMVRIQPFDAARVDYASFTSGAGTYVQVTNSVNDWRFIGGTGNYPNTLSIRGDVNWPITGYSIVGHIYLYSNQNFVIVSTPTVTPTGATETALPPTPCSNSCRWGNQCSANSQPASAKVASLAQGYVSIIGNLDRITDQAALLYRVRDEILNTTEEGQRYKDLYYEHSAEIAAIMISHPEIDEQGLDVIDAFTPNLQALLDGQGGTVTITTEQVQQAQTFLDVILPYASPQLQEAILNERELQPLEQLSGMTMAEAWEEINSIATPTPTNTLTSTATLTSTPTATPTNTPNSTATHILHSFSGFFAPVDNQPTLNVVKAGSGVPIKFSLNGYQGLNIFANGYPASATVTCGSAVEGAIEQTVTAGASSLSYDAAADQYVYTWKTDKAWVDTCRILIIKLDDGTYHRANFKFK